MKLITERTQILEVSEAWAEQYPGGRRNEKQSVVAERLRGLNKMNATAADVAEIIGNSSWTEVPPCSECGEVAQAIVQLGQEPDYESCTAYICRACLVKALALTD